MSAFMAITVDAKGATTGASAPAPTRKWSAPAQGEWAQGLSGKRSDPINFYVHGSLEDVKRAFLKAGWVLPMKNTTDSKLKYLGASIFDQTLGQLFEPKPIKDAVAAMPIAHLKYQGKQDVLSFERDNDPTGGRHHFRVFDTGKVDEQGQKVWAIAASLDDGAHFAPNQPQQWFMSHSVDKNADKERDEIMRTLGKSKGIASMRTHRLEFGASAGSGLNTRDGRVFELWLR